MKCFPLWFAFIYFFFFFFFCQSPKTWLWFHVMQTTQTKIIYITGGWISVAVFHRALVIHSLRSQFHDSVNRTNHMKSDHSILILATFICYPTTDTTKIFFAMQPLSERPYQNLCYHYITHSPELTRLSWEFWGEALTESNLGHPEILKDICFCEATQTTIWPVCGLTLHPHMPLYRSSSNCSTKRYN